MYPSNAGMGAAAQGGLWNPRGIEVVYAAATTSLEVLVHFSVLPRDFVLTEIQIPPTVVIESLHEKDLPAGWDSLSPWHITQEIGRRWAVQLRSAVLSVPSAIVPAERNYVLNPNHPDFKSNSCRHRPFDSTQD
jgi:RES domain-containing protein